MKTSIRVWDLPTRLFHWLLVGSFAGAWLTAESERLQLIHVTLGYTVAGLIVFRLVWGVTGTRWARFRSFLPSPSAAIDYAKALIGKAPEKHYTGHNPLGALAVYALLLLGIAVTASGYGYLQLDQDWLEEAHEVAANGMLALVILHVFGVIVSSLKHRENLVRGMVTGRKTGEADEAIPGNRVIPGILLAVAVGGFWFTAWQQPAALGLTADQAAETGGAAQGDEDDDDD